jgi:hypothetical protein
MLLMFLFESACGEGPGRQVDAMDEDPELYPRSDPQRPTTCLAGVDADEEVDVEVDINVESVWLRSRLCDMVAARDGCRQSRRQTSTPLLDGDVDGDSRLHY